MPDKKFTQEQMDKIALEREGIVPPDMVQPDDLPPSQHGYTFREVGTRGEKGKGYVILVGLTPNARAKIEKGKMRPLIDAGINPTVARAYLRGQYAHETTVMKAFIATHDLPAWDYAPEKVSGLIPKRAMNKFIEEWDLKELIGALSVPRFTALVEGIKRARAVPKKEIA